MLSHHSTPLTPPNVPLSLTMDTEMLTYDSRPQLASKLAASQAPGGYPGAGAPPAGAYPPQSQKAGAYVCHRNS